MNLNLISRSVLKNGLVPVLAAVLLLSASAAHSQQMDRHVSLKEAVKMGLDNSKNLKLAESKIQQAISQYQQTLDKKLPSLKAGFGGSEAFLFSHQLKFGNSTLDLPKHATLFLGTFSATEPIYAGNKLNYAKQIGLLAEKISKLNAAQDKDQITFDVIQAYINLFKIDESIKVVDQNLQDVQGRLEETQKFENQGLATQNDVLRFELAKSNVELSQLELENNREIANYALNVMLGLPDSTHIVEDSIAYAGTTMLDQQDLQQQATSNRKDLQAFSYQDSLAAVQIKNVKADQLPTLGLGANFYYLNPNSKFFPPANTFLTPLSIGLNLNWNISSLYTTRHKVEEATIQKQQVELSKSSLEDNIKIEANKSYHDYLESLKKVDLLHTAVLQASENDRIMEAKYKNQLATTTDRIDAETMLYQSKINLEIAKADAVIAYYNVLKSIGTIQP